MSKGHAVFDGSNIATEGRSEPSYAQLLEAVEAFEEEYDFARITVIADASFEHRVSKSEKNKVRRAIDANEIITPPAGVIGRGDTFILQVADRANAVVVSNDSFQEFHGTFDWLFDDGRLIGGKPIPGVGWVYVPRAPVRGPVSRRARKQSESPEDAIPTRAKPAKKAAASTRKTASKKAVAKKTAAKKTIAKKAVAKKTAAKKPAPDKQAPKKSATTVAADSAPPTGANPVRRWNAFRKAHPAGSSLRATVDEFSSHGAYATADGATIYIPLRLMGDPPPRRARDVVNIGESYTVTIDRFDDERRGIDARLGGEPKPSRRSPRRAAAKKKPAETTTPAKRKAGKKASSTKTAVKKSAKRAPAKKTPAKKTAAKKISRRR